jgi:hypothetical protein
MVPTETMLPLDMGLDDCFYRLKRDSDSPVAMIYAHLKTLDIIPEDSRTYGPDLVKELKKNGDVWDQEWTTLAVFRETDKIHCLQDQWKPHSVPAEVTPAM